MMSSFSKIKVLVIGEAMLDRYLKGTVQRLAREAPVAVIEVEETSDQPGGAANTAANIKSLGGEPYFVSIVGNDDQADTLRQTLRLMDIPDDGIFTVPERQTLTKIRVVGNQQMMIRIDQGTTQSVSSEIEDLLLAHLSQIIPQVDTVIISDYEYGIFTPKIISQLKKLLRQVSVRVFVDAKDLLKYRHLPITAVKPNYLEAVKLLRLPPLSDSKQRLRQIKNHGQTILDLLSCPIAAVTMDKDGVLLFEKDKGNHQIPAPQNEYYNVTGAGDTFISALALAMSIGAKASIAAEFATAAASVVIGKPDTSSCSLEEIKHYLAHKRRTQPALFPRFLLHAR